MRVAAHGNRLVIESAFAVSASASAPNAIVLIPLALGSFPEDDCMHRGSASLSMQGRVRQANAHQTASNRNQSNGLSPLLRYLAGDEYAAVLYGNMGAARVNLSTLRVVWPTMLSNSSIRSLATVIQPGPGCRVTHPTFFFARSFLNAAAVWVHQPLMPPIPEQHTWVEASHCFYRNHQEKIDRYTPMWFLHAPGSGIWLNIGNTWVGRDLNKNEHERLVHKRLVTGFGTGSAPGSSAFRSHLARLMSSSKLLPEEQASQLDTVVFPHQSRSQSWGGERMTEIVLLSGREIKYIDSVLSQLRCGAPPNLRPCRLDEPAVTVHREMCSALKPSTPGGHALIALKNAASKRGCARPLMLLKGNGSAS
jgi:hypothetical protein